MMDKNPVPPDEIESKTMQALFMFWQGRPAEAEQFILERIREATEDVERYFLYLYYGELLIQLRRWEEAREFLTRSASIASNSKNNSWLIRSHEKLGDLAAAEGNSFGALHNYRYTLRMGAALLEPSAKEQLESKANAARRAVDSVVRSPDSQILPLSKEYLAGNMAISFVHRDIFQKKFFARCLECSFCFDACCSYGADIDMQNVEKIQQHKEEILPFVRPPEGEWFEPDVWYYEEYLGNQYTRIRTQGPRCVFISKDQRGCGLHRYAISKNMDYHDIKPLVCILFPLSFGEGILSPAWELDDNSLVCSGQGYSAYQAMKNELEYYFGRELIDELDGIENKVLEQP